MTNVTWTDVLKYVVISELLVAAAGNIGKAIGHVLWLATRRKSQEHLDLQRRAEELERTLQIQEIALEKHVQRHAELEGKLWMQEMALEEFQIRELGIKLQKQESELEELERQTKELKRTTDANSSSEVMSKRALESA